jgi:RNA polymerase sigma factor (sigma-70 family)
MSALFRGAGTAAFDGLYRRHAATVYRYAYAVLGNHADAEDVTQQTFLNAYRALAQGTKPRKAENWLLTIAHNEVRSHFRNVLGKPREVELDEQLAQPARERTDPSVADVLRALQHLPPAQRSAIVMREFEGRSYAEMAQILNVTPSALEALIFRARRSLAERLEGALTCSDAEQALSLDLDGRLGRRESRRLKAHLRECPRCARFQHVQKRNGTLLKGISMIPVPASLLLFRGESAAAATGLGVGAAAAAGGSAGLGVGSAGVATGVATGLVAKAAAVTAAVAVAGGVSYEVTASPDRTAKAERATAHAAAVAQTRKGGRAAAVRAAHAQGARPGPALPASARAHSVAAAKGAARRPVAQKSKKRVASDANRQVPVQARESKSRRDQRPATLRTKPGLPSSRGPETRQLTPAATRAAVERLKTQAAATIHRQVVRRASKPPASKPPAPEQAVAKRRAAKAPPAAEPEAALDGTPAAERVTGKPEK